MVKDVGSKFDNYMILSHLGYELTKKDVINDSTN